MTLPLSIATLTLNPAVDESTSIPRLEPNRKLRCSGSVFHPGGGGINVARAIRNLGGRAAAVFPSGGAAGRRLEKLLRGEGVETIAVSIADSTRENLNVTDETTGRQYRFCKPGPVLAERDWSRCRDAIEALAPLEYLVLSGSLPPGVPSDFYGRIADAAHRRGTRVVLDASGEALRLGAGRSVFLLKTSLSEFETLTGSAPAGENERIRAARRAIAGGRCQTLVLSLGAERALWVSANESGRVTGFDVPVSTRSGAGDSLVGGIVLELSRGAPLRKAVAFGVAAGSAAVMGAGTALCRREDVERLWSRLETATA